MKLSLRVVLPLLLLTSFMAACRAKPKPPPREPPAVCVLTLPEHLKHTKPDALPASIWYELLIKGYRDGIASDAVDCSGEPIAWTPLPNACVEHESESKESARRTQLKDEDLVVRHAGGEYWFGWAPYVSFENGMGEGPLAIARVHKGKLEVRAIGNLRAYTARPRLEVRRLGKQHLLVAEGEYCPKGAACERATRLMWLDRQRFRVRPVRSASQRGCLGPAWFPHTERIQTRLSKRWQRVLQRDVALAFQEQAIVIDERITVSDRDVEQSSLPPRMFREAQAQLRISLEGGELLSEGQSLWNAIRIEDGSTEVGAAARGSP